MSYSPQERNSLNVTASLIKAGSASSASVGGYFLLSGTMNGSASISSGRLVLPAGSSYYLEVSPNFRAVNNGEISWQWYDVTNSQWIGGSAYVSFDTDLGYAYLQGRRVACALVLSSDITGASITVEPRIKTLTSTGWDMVVTATGLSTSTTDIVGYPSARVLEIH
jgi:hypothetical protein